MQKKLSPIPFKEETVKHLHEQLKVNPIICQLLAQRGISTFEEAKYFFRPSLEDLHSPFLMRDMDKAVERVVEAISRKEKILLYGDYDVDGTTCVALMYSFLKDVGIAEYVDYYIPDRYKEGYGISYKGIEYAKENGFSLMIAMDCGITATKQVKKANEYGIDTIICDHHLPGQTLPKGVAVLDPKRFDCDYPYKELSGCGVSFKLCQGIVEAMDLEDDIWIRLLDLLVVSISCDIVEIRGENRILAYYGLEYINQGRTRTGLKALIENSNKELPFSITDIVFGLGPVINAAGRIADAKDAVKLLLEEDETQALAQAKTLMQMNLERREHEKGITEEAINLHEGNPLQEKQKSIVLHQGHWHKGVVGIAASKMVDKFHRPTILLTGDKDMAVGSARSVRGFDIHSAIGECRHLLHNFGGHKYAAGLSIPKENLTAFKQLFGKVVSERITDEQLIPEIPISAELELNDVNDKFWNLLKQFAPFGPGNRRPVFYSKNVRDSGYSKVLKDAHLKLYVKQGNSKSISGIGFWLGDRFDKVNQGEFDICYVLNEKTWKGKRSLELDVREVF